MTEDCGPCCAVFINGMPEGCECEDCREINDGLVDRDYEMDWS